MLSLFATFSVLMALGAAAKVTQDYSRLWFFSWMAVALVVLPVMRILAFRRLRRAFRAGDYVYRALSVGALCDPLQAAEIDRMSDGLSKALPPARLHGLDEIAALAGAVRDNRIDEVYVTVPWALAPEVFRKLEALRYLSANIYVVPAVGSSALSFVRARKRGDDLQIQVLDRPIGGWDSWLKRVFDIVAAATALVMLSPVMAIVSLAIVIESRGPILFRQPRNGFNGGVFELLKFRSMYAEHADVHADQQTAKRDQRVTRVGRFIRRTSLDELPQLFNVLKGHMSIVGPRPHALKTSAEGKLLADAVSDYASRHRVKPGITGWAQVNGLRGELDSIHKLRQRVQYDMEYIENWSIGFDVHIVLRTIRLMLHDPYAY
jgi:Undecaprenyl-phosphate glucose phosphotransferase